jgi:hypothetical protein
LSIVTLDSLRAKRGNVSDGALGEGVSKLQRPH